MTKADTRGTRGQNGGRVEEQALSPDDARAWIEAAGELENLRGQLAELVERVASLFDRFNALAADCGAQPVEPLGVLL